MFLLLYRALLAWTLLAALCRARASVLGGGMSLPKDHGDLVASELAAAKLVRGNSIARKLFQNLNSAQSFPGQDVPGQIPGDRTPGQRPRDQIPNQYPDQVSGQAPSMDLSAQGIPTAQSQTPDQSYGQTSYQNSGQIPNQSYGQNPYQTSGQQAPDLSPVQPSDQYSAQSPASSYQGADMGGSGTPPNDGGQVDSAQNSAVGYCQYYAAAYCQYCIAGIGSLNLFGGSATYCDYCQYCISLNQVQKVSKITASPAKVIGAVGGKLAGTTPSPSPGN